MSAFFEEVDHGFLQAFKIFNQTILNSIGPKTSLLSCPKVVQDGYSFPIIGFLENL